MKRALFSTILSLFASASLFAGTQVTQKQLTNAVNYAISESKNYTDSLITTSVVTFTSITNIFDDSAQEIVNSGDTPKLQWSAEKNCAYVVRRVVEDGAIHYKTNYFDVTKEEITGNVSGAVVLSGGASNLPRGTYLGFMGGDTFGANYGTNQLHVLIEDFMEGTNVLYSYYVISNMTVKTENNIVITNSIFGTGWQKDIECKEIITRTGPTTFTATTNLFSLMGFFITSNTHHNATGMLSPPSTNHDFSVYAGWRQNSIKLTFTQQSETQTAQARRISFFDILFPSAYADGTTSGSTTVLYIDGVLDVPKAPLVDPWVYAPEGVTKDKYWCDCEAVFNRDEFNRAENWFSVIPTTVKLRVTDPPSRRHPEGYTYEVTVYWDLDEILESKLVQIPRRVWPAPCFYEKNQQCYKGHIWVNCHCKYHPEVSRQHVWEGATEDECAHCTLYNSKEKYDARNGIYIPDGESDVVCDFGTTQMHPCSEDNESYHGGWNKHYIDEDFACWCNCGHFNDNHAHKYISTEWTEWSQYDKYGESDGINHWAYILCDRCEQQMKYKNEPHEYDEEEVTETEPVDEYTHRAIDVDCITCDYSGDIVRPHKFDLTRSGVEKCYCETCDDYFHHWTEKGCGKYTNNKCSRCETFEDTEEKKEQHDFSSPTYLNESSHVCDCGSKSHKHYAQNYICVGGYDGTTKAEGDNGCGVNFKETKFNGYVCPTGPINGKGFGDTHTPIAGITGVCPCGSNIHSLLSNLGLTEYANYPCNYLIIYDTGIKDDTRNFEIAIGGHTLANALVEIDALMARASSNIVYGSSMHIYLQQDRPNQDEYEYKVRARNGYYDFVDGVNRSTDDHGDIEARYEGNVAEDYKKKFMKNNSVFVELYARGKEYDDDTQLFFDFE